MIYVFDKIIIRNRKNLIYETSCNKSNGKALFHRGMTMHRERKATGNNAISRDAAQTLNTGKYCPHSARLYHSVLFLPPRKLRDECDMQGSLKINLWCYHRYSASLELASFKLFNIILLISVLADEWSTQYPYHSLFDINSQISAL